MDELFPIIMDMLQDSSSLAKRQVCSFPYVKLLIHCYLFIYLKKIICSCDPRFGNIINLSEVKPKSFNPVSVNYVCMFCLYVLTCGLL